MDSDSKLNVKNSVIDFISDLIDKDFQERVWVRCEGPEEDSYVDFICDFFPLLETVVDNSSEFDLIKHQHSLLLELYEKLKLYEDTAPEEERDIVNDPKWNEIRLYARDVYRALKEELYFRND